MARPSRIRVWSKFYLEECLGLLDGIHFGSCIGSLDLLWTWRRHEGVQVAIGEEKIIQGKWDNEQALTIRSTLAPAPRKGTLALAFQDMAALVTGHCSVAARPSWSCLDFE